MFPNHKPLDKKMHQYGSRVIGGEWDMFTSDFEDHELFVSIRRRFVDGEAWESTPYYRRALDSVSRGISFWHQSRTVEEIDARCAYVDSLFRSICEKGFVPPAGVEEGGGRSGIAKTCQPTEVKVGFGRWGTPVHITGRHRLSIARILGIPLIPVQIAVRHPIWERIRAQVTSDSSFGSQSGLAEHPDVEYLLR